MSIMANNRKQRISLGDLSNTLITCRIVEFIWSSKLTVIGAYLLFGVLPCFILQGIGQGFHTIAAQWPGVLWSNLGIGILFFIAEHIAMLLLFGIELPAEAVVQWFRRQMRNR